MFKEKLHSSVKPIFKSIISSLDKNSIKSYFSLEFKVWNTIRIIEISQKIICLKADIHGTKLSQALKILENMKEMKEIKDYTVCNQNLADLYYTLAEEQHKLDISERKGNKLINDRDKKMSSRLKLKSLASIDANKSLKRAMEMIEEKRNDYEMERDF